MPERTTPYPLPDPAIAQLTPDALAGVAASVARRMYGMELDYTPASLKRLDVVLRERCRLGQYTAESFPDSFALALGAYLGVVLQRHLPTGQWGTSAENLYRTPLPFLLFSRGEFERQINVVEDCLTLFWMGEGLFPHEYYQYHANGLERLGFRVG